MSAPLFDGLDAAGRKHAADEHIVRVALPLPLDRLFDYRVELPGSAAEARSSGEASGEAIAPLLGRRVRVTFSGQVLVGLIVPSDLEDGEPTETHPDDEEPATSTTTKMRTQTKTKTPTRGHDFGVHELSVIDALIDEEPVVSESMIRLLADAAREIFCPIGLAVATRFRPGQRRGRRAPTHSRPGANGPSPMARSARTPWAATRDRS